MSEKSRHEFDFSSFVNSLATASWEILEKVEEEIKNISNVSVENPMSRFRQTAYLRKLEMLIKYILLISSLTCRFGRLTIGAPSSPTMSNKLVYGLDTRLAKIAAEYNVNHIRYADDLYSSSSQPVTLYEVCKKAEDVIAKTASLRLAINQELVF